MNIFLYLKNINEKQKKNIIKIKRFEAIVNILLELLKPEKQNEINKKDSNTKESKNLSRTIEPTQDNPEILVLDFRQQARIISPTLNGIKALKLYPIITEYKAVLSLIFSIEDSINLDLRPLGIKLKR